MNTNSIVLFTFLDKLNLTPEMLAKMSSRIPHSHIKEVIQRLELTLPTVAKNVTLPVATILNIWKNKLDKPRTVLNLWEVLCDASPAVGNEPIRVLHATIGQHICMIGN